MKLVSSLIATILLCGAAVSAQTSAIVFSTEDDFKTQIAAAPCKRNKDRLAAVKELFLKSGAAEGDIRIEDIDGVENVVVTKKGASTETIVVGAHYDKTADGCGAIDNWTGIVILANLYRTLRPLNTAKTYIFVAFGREEEGLIGSKAMAGQIKKEDRANYCAMVNFDSYGFTYPQAMRNISSGPLIKLAEAVSKEMNIPFAQASIEFASSDSASFLEKKIPSISLHGLSDKWSQYLHSPRDKVSNVNTQSVYIGYRHGLIFLAKLEASPCDAFRK